MTDSERRILFALAKMCNQYLNDNGELNHVFMSAGESAIAVLVEYGLVAPLPRGGKWTESGMALLNSN